MSCSVLFFILTNLGQVSVERDKKKAQLLHAAGATAPSDFLIYFFLPGHVACVNDMRKEGQHSSGWSPSVSGQKINGTGGEGGG